MTVSYLEIPSGDYPELFTYVLGLMYPLLEDGKEMEFETLFTHLFSNNQHVNQVRQELESDASNFLPVQLTKLIRDVLLPKCSDVKNITSIAEQWRTIIQYIDCSDSGATSYRYILPGKITETAKDGSCFFHAVATELGRQTNASSKFTYRQLRAKGIEYIRNNRDIFKDFFSCQHKSQKYLNQMSLDATYAEGVIINAVSMMLNIQLNIIDIDTHHQVSLITIPVKKTEHIITLKLEKLHYEVVEVNTHIHIARICVINQAMHPCVNPEKISRIKLPLKKWNAPLTSPENFVESIMGNHFELVITELPTQLKCFKVDKKTSQPKARMGLLAESKEGKLTLRGKHIDAVKMDLKQYDIATNLEDKSSVGTISSWIGWALPTLLTLGWAGVAKAYADTFKTTLIESMAHIKNNEYAQAAELLEKEIDHRLQFNQHARSAILSYEEYAVGHLLFAVCKEQEGMYEQAYLSYEKAIEYFEKCQKKSIILMIEMHLIDLIKNQPEQFSSIIPSDILSQKIKKLNDSYTEGFNELYWTMQEQITTLASVFLSKNKLSEQNILLINHVLSNDILYMLTYFSAGYGKLFEIFYIFFQAALLYTIDKSSLNILKQETKTFLINQAEDPDADFVAKKLALVKCRQCAESIQKFKIEHSLLMQDQSVRNQIAYLESFIVNIFALEDIYLDSISNQYRSINKILNIPEKNSEEILENKKRTVRVLSRIKEDFNLSYSTILSCLEACIQSPASFLKLVSKNTGDTILHYILEAPVHPEQTEKAAIALKEISLVRNGEGKTVFYKLRSEDPLNLKSSLAAEPFSDFKEIKTSIDKIQKGEKFFIYLSGPDVIRKKELLSSVLIKNGQYQLDDESSNIDFSKYFATLDSKKYRILLLNDFDNLLNKQNIDEAKLRKIVRTLHTHKVICIFISEFSYQCDSFIADFSDVDCFYYDFPSKEQREELLNYYLRDKQILSKQLTHLAHIAIGFTSQMLYRFANSIKEISPTDNLIAQTIDKFTRAEEKRFQRKFKDTEFHLLCYTSNSTLEDLSPELQEWGNRLQDEILLSPMHTLLVGESSSDKNELLKQAAQYANRILITFDLTLENFGTISNIIDIVNQFPRSILFLRGVHTLVEKKSTSGFANALSAKIKKIDNRVVVVVDVKNSTELDSGLKEFFRDTQTTTSNAKQLRKMLLEGIQKCSSEFEVYFDELMIEDVVNGLPFLQEECAGLSGQDIRETINLMIADLIRENKSKSSARVCLTRDDFIYCVQTKKIRRGLIQSHQSSSLTFSEYLSKQNSVIWPQMIPPKALPALDMLNSSVMPKHSGLSEEERQKLFNTILSKLNTDFNLTFESIESCLDAILENPSPYDANMSSSVSGDTLLHVLSLLPRTETDLDLKITKVAEKFKAVCYKRNLALETPLYRLEQSDPLNLKSILCPRSLLKIGNELDKIEEFLLKIKNKPAIKGHFLLLDGPPGTGKTDAIEYFKRLNYPVYEWKKGDDNDKFVGQLDNRIISFFETAVKTQRSSTVQILFIDEIDSIVPKLGDTKAQAGSHSRQDEITTIQIQLNKLKNQRVVLIGATNFPDNIAKAIISRAGVNRITYTLPNEQIRHQLLEHFFRKKKISPAHIEQIAHLAIGFSPRQLKSFVESIQEETIHFECLTRAFNDYALTISKDFTAQFSGAFLFMPCFQTQELATPLYATNFELAEQLDNLSNPGKFRQHTLLYGPPGGGKTSAVREFATTLKYVLISIDANPEMSVSTLQKIFSFAKQLAPALIFIDEIDRIALRGGSLTALLQTEMGGLIDNQLTIIGATNYLTSIAREIRSRFTCKIWLSRLTPQQLNDSVKSQLIKIIKTQPAHFCIDIALNEDNVKLNDASGALDFRQIKAAFDYLINALIQSKPQVSGFIYLRLQDVVFSLNNQRIQEQLIPRPDVVVTRKQYIQMHRESFFKEIRPDNSIHIMHDESNTSLSCDV